MKKLEIPFYEKPLLSLEEATVYTGICKDKLREISNSDDCEFVLWNGNKRYLKREKLVEYLTKSYSI